QAKQTLTLKLILSPLEANRLDLSLLNVQFSSSDSNHTPELFSLFTPIFEIAITEPVISLESLYSDLPLLPLQPEMPVHLDSENRFALFNSDQVHQQIIQNKKILQWHSFPWFF